MAKAKLILVGGYLGAGKTTLLASAARLLQLQGKKVGVITNDQATGLVDTHTLKMNGLDVEEIAGSCFCCNFDGFTKAATYLSDSAKSEIIIAEPVGSCTDLSATLMQPIKARWQKYFDLAPLSVLVDPVQAKVVLQDKNGSAGGSGYIYLKQLEEADYIVVNKTDLLNQDDITGLGDLLNSRFPDYSVSWISAYQETGIQNWMDKVSSDTWSGRRIADVNYDVYAKVEALMGWYNASFLVKNTKGLFLPWKQFNENFLELLQKVFQHDKVVVGHLKTFLKSGPSHLTGNLTGTFRRIDVRGEEFSSQSARMVLNIRAETSSLFLKEVMDDIIQTYEEHSIRFEIIELKHFSPARPEPTHRYDKVV